MEENFSQISQHSFIVDDEFARHRAFNNAFVLGNDDDRVLQSMPNVEGVKEYCKNICVSC